MTIRGFIKQHSCFGAMTSKQDVGNVSSQSDAAKKLQAAILAAIGRLTFPPGLGVGNAEIVSGIRQNLDAKAFDRHNQDLGVVEARATFNATTDNCCPVFNLIIIWGALSVPFSTLLPPNAIQLTLPDADVPPTESPQLPHFGWEIYMDGVRVAGPSHVFFEAGRTLKYYRRPGYEQVEEHSLKMSKCGTMGTGKMLSQTNYYKLAR